LTIPPPFNYNHHMTMTNTTTTTTRILEGIKQPIPNYAFLTGALEVSLEHFSGDLFRAGLITYDQIEAVNKLAAAAYELSHRLSVEHKAKFG